MYGNDGNDTLVGDSIHAGPSLILNNSDTNDYAAAANLTDFPTSAITVEMQFAVSKIPSDATIFFNYAVAAQSNEIMLIAKNASNAAAWGGMSTGDDNFALLINNIGIDFGVSSGQYLDGEFHALAVSWDSASGTAKLYIDGTLVSTQTGQQGYTLTQGGTIVFGQEQDSVGGGFDANQIFIGEMDDIRLFNDIRTDQEISENYGHPLSDPSNEQGLYRTGNSIPTRARSLPMLRAATILRCTTAPMWLGRRPPILSLRYAPAPAIRSTALMSATIPRRPSSI
ncbi:MAG: LamG-like jellyroll fold domain-containing protein [Tepidamorphaceae bacterium]